MTLNGVMAVVLRYFSEFDGFLGALRKGSRSLSHLVMSSRVVLSLPRRSAAAGIDVRRPDEDEPPTEQAPPPPSRCPVRKNENRINWAAAGGSRDQSSSGRGSSGTPPPRSPASNKGLNSLHRAALLPAMWTFVYTRTPPRPVEICIKRIPVTTPSQPSGPGIRAEGLW